MRRHERKLPLSCWPTDASPPWIRKNRRSRTWPWSMAASWPSATGRIWPSTPGLSRCASLAMGSKLGFDDQGTPPGTSCASATAWADQLHRRRRRFPELSRRLRSDDHLAGRGELNVRLAHNLFTQRPGAEYEDFAAGTISPRNLERVRALAAASPSRTAWSSRAGSSWPAMAARPAGVRRPSDACASSASRSDRHARHPRLQLHPLGFLAEPSSW